MSTSTSRRGFLKSAALTAGGALLAACAPQVIKETVEVTVEVEKAVTVKETVMVAGTPQVVEKLVTPVPGETVNVSFWHGDWSVWNPHFDHLAANAYYAGVRPKIELEAPPMPWNEYWDKITISGEAGVGPDILYLNYNSYKRVFDAKSVLPIPESVYPYSELEKDFLPQAMEVLKIYDGQYYYVPWELHPPGCIQYNKSLLEREGFTEPPKNWEEFLEIGQTCVKREGGQVVQTAFGGDGPYMLHFTILYPSLGGVGPGPMDWEAPPEGVKSEEFAEAFEMMADYTERKYDLLHPEFLIAVGGWWGGAYLFGKVAFEWWYSGANITLEEQTLDKGGGFDTQIALPKLGPGGFKGGTRPNWGPAVTTACPEEKLDVVWDFVKHTLSKEELLNYIQLTYLPSPNTEILSMGREAFPAGPRGDEAAIELNNIACCSFIFGNPQNETIWREAFQDTWDDIIGGMTAKDAIEDNWGKYVEGWTGQPA